MRIYDSDSDRTLGSIDLFLNHDDVDELIEVLRALQSDEAGSHRQAVEREPSQHGYVHEINVALYEEGDVPEDWPERAAEIIVEDR